jgi:hypothetical protein
MEAIRVSTARLEPQRSRVTEDEIDGFRIAIPIDPSCGEIYHFCAGLLGWLIVEIVLVNMVFSSLSHRPIVGDPPVWGVLFLALVSTGVGIAWLIWLFPWGRRSQIINIADEQLLIRLEGVRGDDPKSYQLSKIRNLRYSPAVDSPLLAAIDPTRAGRIAFDHGESTVHFGPGLSDRESRRLIKTIMDRYKIAQDKDEALPVERI